MLEMPRHWWSPITESDAAEWEVLPQAARTGEVILSKRNELGILSNFAPTPFVFRGKCYASIEGWWQMMFFPENEDDPRSRFPGLRWPFSRDEVARMSAFEAKAAGDLGFENMKEMGIDWVSFEGRRMIYWTPEKGEHYKLVVEALWEKLKQNPPVRETLLRTGDLILRPDHRMPADAPPSWKYFEIWMEIRTALRRQN